MSAPEAIAAETLAALRVDERLSEIGRRLGSIEFRLDEIIRHLTQR